MRFDSALSSSSVCFIKIILDNVAQINIVSYLLSKTGAGGSLSIRIGVLGGLIKGVSSSAMGSQVAASIALGVEMCEIGVILGESMMTLAVEFTIKGIVFVMPTRFIYFSHWDKVS